MNVVNIVWKLQKFIQNIILLKNTSTESWWTSTIWGRYWWYHHGFHSSLFSLLSIYTMCFYIYTILYGMIMIDFHVLMVVMIWSVECYVDWRSTTHVTYGLGRINSVCPKVVWYGIHIRNAYVAGMASHEYDPLLVCWGVEWWNVVERMDYHTIKKVDVFWGYGACMILC